MCLILALASIARAASPDIQWSMRSWESDEGLPDNTVVGVEQTADGFLWVATRAGLARFDGVKFQEFAPVTAAGVPTALLYASYLDRSNRLWIAKGRGVIVCVDRGRTTAFTPEDGLPAYEIRMMEEDREGALWVSYIGSGVDGGVGGEVVRILGKQVQSFTSKDGLPGGNRTCQLARDKNGQIWLAQGNDIGVYSDGKFKRLLTMQGQRIAAARSGGIWIYNNPSQLYKFSEEGSLVTLGRLPADRTIVNATVLYEDRRGALWIGTEVSGLFRYDGAKFTAVETSHYNIRSITEDREGNLWVGTQGGGLNRIQPRSLKLLDVHSGIKEEAVRSVCQDIAGQLWAVTQSGVLVRNSGEGWRNASTNDGVHIQYAQCVAADPRGGVWVGSQYLGLFSSRKDFTFNLNRTNGLAAQSIRSLLATLSGDVWIGTESPNTLQRLRGGRFKTFELPAGSAYVTTMALDASDKFWAGTADGLLLSCKNDVLVDETENSLTPPESIRSLCATPDGSLWIGYGGRGLGLLKGDGFVQFSTADGLYDNYISHIVADRQGRLWFAGNRGIFYVKQSEFEGLEVGQAGRLRSVAYGSDEGLPSLQANHGFSPGAILTTNGNLLIPTLTGLASMDLEHLRQNLRRPTVVINRVVVDGRLVADHEAGEMNGSTKAAGVIDLGRANPRLRLPPDHQRVEIEFSAPSFTSPKNVFFQYRLEGGDYEGDWKEAGSKREISYTHIDAGDYNFRVRACNDWGAWTDSDTTLSITVLPHYWQTWTFRIMATLAAFALVASSVAWVVRARHRRRIEQLERQQDMERERARIAQDLHDDLGSGLTEISFGSEFAQDPMLGLEETRQHTREIGNRARELVGSLDEIVWAVNPKNDTLPSLVSYLTQYAERFLKHTPVRFRLDVARDLPAHSLNADERHNLFLAFKEALNNVVQHSKAVNVQLTIRVEGNCLHVLVRDDGCGFDPKNSRIEADGLGNMRRRMEKIGGSFELETQPGRGSSATFRFRLRQQPRSPRE